VLNAALLMQKRNFRHLPVTDASSGRILGLISAQDVIDSLALVLEHRSISADVMRSLQIPVERIMNLHCIVVEPGDGFSDVVKKIVNQNLGAIPVVNEVGSVQGIVTLRDLVGLMGISSEPLNVDVSELMTYRAISIDRDQRISEAVRLMSTNRVRRLPIFNSESKQLLGMLTSKDILRHLGRLSSSGQDDREFDLEVKEFMTREVITISGEEDIRTAASRMMIFGVGGLAVDDAPDIALITERDLIRKLAQKRSLDFLMRSIQYEIEAESSTSKAAYSST
jgi:CBS domain-containing protein